MAAVSTNFQNLTEMSQNNIFKKSKLNDEQIRFDGYKRFSKIFFSNN